MAISTDILASYLHPRAVIRRRLDQGVREDQALALLLAACALNLVAQGPGLVRAAALDPSRPLDARIGGAALATLFLLPLLAYGLAALSHLVARAFGGQGSGYGARLALFWALLAIAPVLLVQALARGFFAYGMMPGVIAGLVLALFLWLWLAALIEVENTV
ncbi:MAG: YIP1 family protein [Pseudorhodobacter sp.]|nr:YIP1 family protein [Pseudorhodobacter sp.]